MSGKEKLGRAVRDEEEAFGRLKAQRTFAEQLLKEPDQLLSHERVPREGFEKLHQAAKNYDATIEAVMVSAQDKADAVIHKEQWYKEKISEQMKEVDLLLNQLFKAVNAFKLPVSPPSTANRAKHLLSSINFKIKAAQLCIETKTDIVSTKVIDLQAQDALPKVEASLKMLQEVMDIVKKDLDLTEEILNVDLYDEQVEDLIKQVCEMSITTTPKVDVLHADLLEK